MLLSSLCLSGSLRHFNLNIKEMVTNNTGEFGVSSGGWLTLWLSLILQTKRV